MRSSFTPTESAWVTSRIGSFRVLGQPPQSGVAKARGRAVIEVLDRAGERCFVKRIPALHVWVAETHAYRTWVAVVKDLAPSLLAADPALRLLIISAVSGVQAGPSADAALHRQAGVWLRRFHGAEAARDLPRSFHGGTRTPTSVTSSAFRPR